MEVRLMAASRLRRIARAANALEKVGPDRVKQVVVFDIRTAEASTIASGTGVS